MSKMTKAQLVAALATETNLKKAQVQSVLESLVGISARTLKSEGVFVVPGMVNIKVKTVAAKPARTGVNPFTKEPMNVPAKPASSKLGIRPVKAFKQAAGC